MGGVGQRETHISIVGRVHSSTNMGGGSRFMLDIESAWLEKVDDILGCFRLIGGVKEHAVVNLVL